jgi:uncharacterized protein
MRRFLAIFALLCAFVVPAAALDFPPLDGRVVDEAHLLDAAKKSALELKLADLEAKTSLQFMVVTLASARGMTVDDYGLELRKHWGQDPNGKRVALIVSPQSGRSVIQFDRPLSDTLPDSVTDAIFQQALNPRINSGDFSGAVTLASEAIIKALSGEKLPDMRLPAPPLPAPPPQRMAQNDITVPATSEFPALSGRVVDDAGVLDASTREQLRAKLAALEARSGIQVVVATVKSLNGNAVEDYANRLFRRWQLGQKGKNNGVLLLHAPAERKIRIEVGYGLEGTLTDAATKYIITNSIAPRFKANDFSGGMTRGVDDILKALSGDEEFKQRITTPAHNPLSNMPPFVFIMVAIVLFIVIRAIIGASAPTKPGSRSGSRSNSGDWFAAGAGSSSSSWSSSSSSSSSDSFSGGGGDSGGGGSSGDY